MASFNSHSVSNIVDDWMKDANDLLPSTCADDEQEAVQPTISSTQKGRVGLGFENKSVGADGSRVKNDALLEKLKKSDKKRKRENDQSQLQSHSLSHGLVEDDEEFESRIKVVSSLAKKVDPGSEEQMKPVTSSKFTPKSNINKQSNVKSSQNNNEKKISNASQPVIPIVSESKDVEAVNSTGEGGNQTDKTKKRKRIKTRSKQKNIRRDNRPDDQKPSHLKFGSGEYKGRPITAQTREKLGLPFKKSKHEHFSG